MRSIRVRGTCSATATAVKLASRGRGCFAEQSHGRFYKLRDDAILPLICPTCQFTFAGPIEASVAGLLCMGLFSIFW
jgi:hypothetical protein